MKVVEMKECEDGGAELQIDMTEDERCFMIEFGFNQLSFSYSLTVGKRYREKKVELVSQLS